MKLKDLSSKRTLIINLSLLLCLLVIVPIILDLIVINSRIIVISFLGNSLVIILIIVLIVDFFLLIVKKLNYQLLSTLNMVLTLFVFILLMYCFLNNIFEIVYVMNYSNSALPLIYKIVFIWAGENGSILTWMMFNSVIVYFYRIKNQNREDLVFIRSVLISLVISIVFLFILLSVNTFKLDISPAFINGNPNLHPSLDPILMSPFMIWHPFFTFIAYGIFLIPFTITIAEITTRNLELMNSYEQEFYNFSVKFGWLVLTLSIGLGAYWAKIALNWGRYWGWDPVETVSLIPWLFSTAFFHTIIFKKKNPNLIKINVGIIFLSIIYSTLVTRGGISPIHSFTGGSELIVWTVLVGLILTGFSLYVIYIVLDYLMEEYRNKKLLFDYLSYLFLFGLSFVCIFGLLITPLTNILSTYFPLNEIYIGPDFYIITSLILAIGLAVTLVFCSLWEYFDLKWIGLIIILGVSIQSVLSFSFLFFSGIWINPIIVIYFISIISSFYKFTRNFTMKKGIAYFFRINSKTIIHSGISFILVGTIIPSMFETFQDIFFITGFILFLVGIIPSILRTFFLKKEHKKD
ncbi:MAG: cytochrome c biogenesis protein CcsA [Candidatus Lokiarchaeota archaeon]|nr:cytochrome c biogenesis protein CcsA [Candidatus Lokiarchaeota archaeon]